MIGAIAPASIICGINAIGTRVITFSVVETMDDNNKPIKEAATDTDNIHKNAPLKSAHCGSVSLYLAAIIAVNKSD